MIANQVMMGQLVHDYDGDGDPGDPPIYWHDAWDGYPVARQRIIDHLAEARIRNPMIITGDWHSTFVNDIKADFSDPGRPRSPRSSSGRRSRLTATAPCTGPTTGR